MIVDGRRVNDGLWQRQRVAVVAFFKLIMRERKRKKIKNWQITPLVFFLVYSFL